MEDDGPPLIAGRIHGIRVWSIASVSDSGLLHGVTGGGWKTGGEPTVAVCNRDLAGSGRRHRRHRAPEPDCGCGLYAVHPHSAETALAYLGGRGPARGAIAGIVEAWGEVELHQVGFRAQYARPIAFAVAAKPGSGDLGRMAARIARGYRAELVPVLDPHDLVLYCQGRGWGLAREVVASLVPEEAPAVAEPPVSRTGISELARQRRNRRRRERAARQRQARAEGARPRRRG